MATVVCAGWSRSPDLSSGLEIPSVSLSLLLPEGHYSRGGWWWVWQGRVEGRGMGAGQGEGVQGGEVAAAGHRQLEAVDVEPLLQQSHLLTHVHTTPHHTVPCRCMPGAARSCVSGGSWRGSGGRGSCRGTPGTYTAPAAGSGCNARNRPRNLHILVNILLYCVTIRASVRASQNSKFHNH